MDDADLTSRVERCLRDADPDLSAMWRKCVSMHGVRSAAAEGCMLALVRSAWDPYKITQYRNGVCEIEPIPGRGPYRFDDLGSALDHATP